jgi:ParB family transcriptional regulator, chromosome partitioning protein
MNDEWASAALGAGITRSRASSEMNQPGQSVILLQMLIHIDVMASDQELRQIPLSSLQRASYNVRDSSSIEDLARSIKNQGVLEPLLVNESNRGERNYEIIAGARRAEAARKAGLETVPCLVMSVNPTQAELISIIENVQRLNYSAIERARVIEKIVERVGGNKSKTAEALGFSSSKVISEWLSPLDLDPEALNTLKPIAGPTMNRRTALLSTVPKNKQKTVAELLNEKARDEGQVRKIVNAVKEHPTEDPRTVVERLEKIPKPISVQVFLHERLNNALEQACQKERLSKSNLIQKFIEERLTQDGYLSKPDSDE